MTWEASREETAHRITWSAVKRVYEKNSKGNWVKKN
ncbi:ChaB family protein [Methanosarcina baikalica]